MKADAILEEVKELPQTELRSLVLKLADVLDEESNGELASILETRKRAAGRNDLRRGQGCIA
ncbi:MAG: hypothetical protein ACI9VS_000664 [Candidatus Binatia bacterium]|jgi:hypothetical protein